MNNEIQPAPFKEINYDLMNDDTDASILELDGIELCSCNSWDIGPFGGIPDAMQEAIHSTIRRVGEIIKDYRDGKLVYKGDEA